jgi:glycerophosphoryl diester phosphodiesterase
MNPKWSIAVLLTLLWACNEERTEYPAQIRAGNIQPPLIVAHRGGMAYAPENTIVALENGIRVNADVLNFDVQFWHDEFIVLHDLSLDRTTNCSLPSSAADQYVRASCDAGYHWQPGNDTFSKGAGWPYFTDKGLRIPVLDDVLDAVSEKNIRLMIELKHNSALPGPVSLSEATDRLLLMIQQYGFGSRIMINASSSFVLARTEALLPEATTILSWGTQLEVPCATTVRDAISRGFDGVSLQATNQIGRPGVDACALMVRDAGMILMFWTVNEPKMVERLLLLGPSAILTDYPACLIALLHRIQIANPSPESIGGQVYYPKYG